MKRILFLLFLFVCNLLYAEPILKDAANWRLTYQKIAFSIFFYICVAIILKYLTILLEKIAEKWTSFRLTLKKFIPILRISIWTMTIYIIIAGILKPPFQTIIAVTASAGIAIGFASQDILKNIFGGIMIIFDRPFQVGDKIQVGDYYGEVISIGMRSVRIVTPDDSVVSIPNSEIVNHSVSNSNKGENDCQVVSECYLDPDIDYQLARSLAYQAASVSRYVHLKKPVVVLFIQEMHMGKPKIKVRIKAYVIDIRYEFAFMSDMTEIFLEAVIENNWMKREDIAALNPDVERLNL